ncbi:MAG: hypothetical protein ACRD4L_05605, partial [Pyrinomonadaceae bacterium]
MYINTYPHGASDVLSFLKSLRLELVFIECTTIMCCLLSCSLGLLTTVGLADYRWQLSHTTRLIFLMLSSICIGAGFLFVLWKIFKKPSLVQIAIQIEQKSDRSRNAITTLSEL